MNYETLINPTLRGLRPSGIRKFFDIANEMEDVITLSIGEPDFSTPWHIRQGGDPLTGKGEDLVYGQCRAAPAAGGDRGLHDAAYRGGV